MEGNGEKEAPPTFSSSQSEAANTSRRSPPDGAGVLSLSTLSWLTPLMFSMSRKQLDFTSLCLSPEDGADANGDRLQSLWDQEVCSVGLQKASLSRVLLRFQRKRLLLVFCINVLFIMALFTGSGVLVHEILGHIIHVESSTAWVGVALCFGLVTVEIFRVCCLTLSWSLNLRTGVRLKTGFCVLGVNKVTALRTHGGVCLGQTAKVLTSDSQVLLGAVLLGPLLLPFPLLLIICSIYTCSILDYTALIGFFVFIVFILLQFVFVRLVNHLQQRAASVTSDRVSTVNELLVNIELIKMNVWESAFISKITDIRASERRMLENAALIQNLSVTISPLAPVIATMCTFLVHTWLGLPIITCTAYPVITIFNCMRFILSMGPLAVKLLAEAAVSVKRLEKLLRMENPEPYVSKTSSAVVVVENATLSWNKRSHPTDTDDRDDLVSKPRDDGEVLPPLRNVSFTLQKGRLLGVCGGVGAGKTSLICSLLEQMHLLQGSVSVNGSMAYVSQQTWIFYGTIQENILMGETLDQLRYDDVVRSCYLEEDFHKLPDGDQTLCGVEGVSLSEDQKQRISLARAVYSDKDLYLLDQPLSNVDAHLRKVVFEESVRKLLQGKSVILVTQQLQFLEFCDEVLLLKDGTVLEKGNHLDLMKANGLYAEFLNKHLREQPQKDESQKKTEPNDHRNGEIINPAADQLIHPENERKSSVTWRTFQQYCHAAGGYCVSLFVLLIFILMTTNVAMSYWWLSFWLRHGHGSANVTSSADAGNLSLNPDLPLYQLGCGVMMLSLLAVCVIKSFCYIKVTFHASTSLHNRLLQKVVASQLSFFEAMAPARLLACFSRRQDEVDNFLPHHLNILLSLWFTAVSVFIINSVIFPVMVLPVCVLVTVFTLLLWMFRGNIIQLQRMESSSRAACSSLCSSMTEGLSTIQTYNQEQSFTSLFKKLSDANTNHLLLLHYGMRWLCFWADSLCAVMTLPVALLVVFVSNDVSSPPVKALALCLIIMLTSNSQPMIQSLLEVEVRFINVQQLLHLSQSCVSEEAAQVRQVRQVHQVRQVSEDWPQHGAVTFLDYNLRHRQSSPVVLKLQLHIRGGEKVGVVGGARSGKSSLAAALFRLVEACDGCVLIDGVDVSSLHLNHLRSHLSIVPQEPVIFTGTVRFNLDPLQRCSDSQIWAALEKTCMKDSINSLQNKLDAVLTNNGRQLSVRQKQLMSLSRALLRETKIVLLDESSAPVDAETDALIQTIVSDAFRRCTVITITHRVTRVLQVDRVLVLDRGQVVEFDRPDVLRQKTDSVFSQLLSAANAGVS